MVQHTRESLIEQYKLMHEQVVYGNTSIDYLDDVQSIIYEYKVKDVLDFGCGQSELLSSLDVPVKYWYDPAIPGKDKLPSGLIKPHDLIICTDVMEHVLEDNLTSTLFDLWLMGRRVFFTISCRPAKKRLPDGSDPHVTVKSPDWWMEKLGRWWGELKVIQSNGNHIVLLADQRVKGAV